MSRANSLSRFTSSPGAVFALALCLSALGNLRASSPNTQIATTGNSYTVCPNVPVPPNYALIEINAATGCSNLLSFVVAPAQSGLHVCNLSETIGGAPVKMPFPADYYVQNISHIDQLHSVCAGATSVYMIQLVSEGATACSGSHIPDGWSFTASVPGNDSCETTVRNELHQSVDGLRICQGSPYPDAFVIGEIEPIAACNVQERYVLRPTTDGVQTCGISHVPAGYVVTGADRSGRCSSYQTLTLRTAYDGVVVCTFSPIPSRYVVAATVPYSGCQDWNTAYQLRYIP